MPVLMEIALDKLVVSPLNVRRALGDVAELVASIKEQGVLEPILVRPVGNRYEVIAGSRRYAASNQAGLKTIPAVVQEMTDTQAVVRSLVENLQRGDLSLEERVEAYKKLQSLDPQQYGSVRAVAKVIGKDPSTLVKDFDAYEALIALRPHGIQVVTKSPQAEERKRGEALPERHATLLQRAMTAVQGRLSGQDTESKYVELAHAIAPLEQERAIKLLDEFKKYPEKPLGELEHRAFAVQRVDWNLPAPTVRRLEEMAERAGVPRVEEYISRLVEEDKPDGAEEEAVESHPLSTGSRIATQERLPLEEEERYAPVELPEEPMSVQLKNKVLWNLNHFTVKADFYTTCYSGREIDQFIEILKAARVSTLVDVRHAPVSPYKPDFSKENLSKALERAGVTYVHRSDLGVPREIRVGAAGEKTREQIWKWYDENVIPRFINGTLRQLTKSLKQPIALMCVEADPTACHRHRLFLALEKAGLRGYDL